MYIHIHTMATKTISITEDAYERLKSWKDDNDSFSDVILRIGRKNKLSDFAGILSKASKKELSESFKAGREQSRKRAKTLGC